MSSDAGLSVAQALARLAAGEVVVEGRLPWSSNATYLARVVTAVDTEGLLAVYKPRRGERPLWDFPVGTLYRREVAAFAVSEALGWQLVPPTLARDGPYGPGMLQAFIAHDPDRHYLSMDAADIDAAIIARLVAFDAVINNADRKSGHVLEAEDGALWAIDHGVAFHVEPKLRTVIWELAGERLPADLAVDLARLADDLLQPAGELACALADLLSPAEVEATARRARKLARTGRFPDADPDRRSYPWPPV
jgi:hypothetical protein